MLNRVFLILTIFYCSSAFSNISAELKSLIAVLQDGKKTPLKTLTCNIQKEKWATILLTKQDFVETIKFNKECDLEGANTVKADKFFPVSLKLRNLKSYKQVKFNMKFNIVFTNQAVLHLLLRRGELIGKNTEYFELQYSMAIDPMNPKQFISKRMGGEVAIMDSKYKKILKRYPIK